MTADDGMSAVHAVLSGAVQPDASGGVGDPLANLKATINHVVAAYAKATADAVASDPHWVTLDLNDHALRERLMEWQVRAELGGLAEASIQYWLTNAHAAEWRQRRYAWADALLALLAELGRAG